MQEQAMPRGTIALNKAGKVVIQKPPMPEDLTQLLNLKFKKERHGKRTEVTLIEVGRNKVRVTEAGRKDSYHISTAEFRKFYEQVQ